MRTFAVASLALSVLGLRAGAAGAGREPATDRWTCPILPPEHDAGSDPLSGARVVFVTNHAADDVNLYFHENSWLPDGSMLVFMSNRTGRSEPFGYLEATGHLVRLNPEGRPVLGAVTCSRRGPRLYGVRNGAVVAWTVEVAPGPEPHVRICERAIAKLPDHGGLQSALSENADGRWLALAIADSRQPGHSRLLAIEVEGGRVVPVVERVPYVISHVQFSWTRPYRIMFARTYSGGDRAPADAGTDSLPRSRIWHVDLGGGPPRPVYEQKPGELVTHECWWTEDRFTFCGGHHEPDESHVKVFDTRTGRISILGAGSWWPGGAAAEITRRAWWHAAGSPDGRWVVADNFHGDIVLFDARTTEERPLTTGHRRYGRGEHHAHPGWAPSSDRVVFCSNRRGNPDVAIVHVPRAWR